MGRLAGPPALDARCQPFSPGKFGTYAVRVSVTRNGSSLGAFGGGDVIAGHLSLFLYRTCPNAPGAPLPPGRCYAGMIGNPSRRVKWPVAHVVARDGSGRLDAPSATGGGRYKAPNPELWTPDARSAQG